MRRRSRTTATTGTLRVDARPARLVPRLQHGDIAVLDHVDLDSATAQALLARGVAAVVNAAPSSSGRYPNLGPGLLVRAGIPLLDDVGSAVLTRLREGSAARLDGDGLWVDEERVARGMRQDSDSIASAGELARGGVAAQLADLAGAAVAFLLDERALVLDGVGLPSTQTSFEGKTVIVVGPAYDGAAQLRSLKRFRRRAKALLLAVDGGGDVLLAQGLQPNLLVGDPDTMSVAALRAAGEVLLREGTEGRDRVHELAVPALSCASRASSEDIALLLLHHAGARLVISVGLPRTLEELLDRGRAAAASSLLTRFAVGARVVAGDAVPHVFSPPGRALPYLTGVLGAAVATAVAVWLEELTAVWHHLAG